MGSAPGEVDLVSSLTNLFVSHFVSESLLCGLLRNYLLHLRRCFLGHSPPPGLRDSFLISHGILSHEAQPWIIEIPPAGSSLPDDLENKCSRSGNSARLSVASFLKYRAGIRMKPQSEEAAQKQAAITIRDLYPTLTEQELKEAERNFYRYVEIALEIQEGQFCGEANPSIDTCPLSPTMKERSNFSLKN
jgi:hypothetical protein